MSQQQRPLLDPSPIPSPASPFPFSFAPPPDLPSATPSFPAAPVALHSHRLHPPRSRSVQISSPQPPTEPRMLHSKSADSRFAIPSSSLELAHLSKSTAAGSSLRHFSGTLDAAGGENRVVFINNPALTKDTSAQISGNRISTSKYTLLSFLPRNLFEQFHRVAYIYFLIIAILNQLPQLAVFGRTASLFPLVFVLVITAIKDAYEDWRRHRSDKKENHRLALVLHEGEYRQKSWKHVEVGEMIKVHANETIPCDLVLLATSDESGLAYVQTINLDGESNLKTRYARPETAASHPELGPISGKIICEKPNRNIYGFSAYMQFEDKKLPLGPTNVILRGCELKNTSWAVGVAVYTGQETKVMLNSSGTQSKRSRLEQKMNREILWLSVFLFIMCFIGAVGMGLWLRRHKEQLNVLPYYGKKYLSTGKDYNYYGNFGEPFFGFLSFVIIFQIMIPISLYISMELVRLGQSFFMIRDSKMYHAASNSRFQCRALNINEDLGQIKYVFSDKTGTLTENKMEFQNASIHGVNYDNSKVIVGLEGDNDVYLKHEENRSTTEVLGKQIWQPKPGAKVDPKLVQILQGSYSWERQIVHDYLLTLAACNTVVPTKVKVTDTGRIEMEAACASDEAGLVEYQGESPDEQALVYATASYGYTLLERNSNEIVISVLGEIQRFHLLGLHEFDSVRKCMSVVVQCPDNTIKVLVKGADASILSKLAKPSGATEGANVGDSKQAEVISATREHLDLYAREGLRTLLVAAKELTSVEFNVWKDHYARASTALVDRGGAIRETAELVEKDLLLLGATGIEDKLQDGVPEAIASLREAGIKIWVLTGDKQETAISIGFSCSLLTNDMQQIIINEREKDACRQALYNAKATYGLKTGKRSSSLTRRISVDVKTGENLPDISTSNDFFSSSALQSTSMSISSDMRPLRRTISKEKKDRPLALIIDGNSLVHALDSDLEQEFYDLARACKAVICCRVAPLQKAGIVSLVKQRSSDMTLAIGDGANDVSMIQTADVGVGISGQEGRQAVMASDFAMGQFRFLKRLLLVHGHWNYSRLGYMVLYNFYRNAAFIFVLFWYIFYTAFSPISAVTDWSAVFYSLIYTSVPTIVVGILDKDVSSKTLLKYHALYRVGQLELCYNKTLFWITMLDTLWQSLVVFFVPVFTYRQSTIDIWGLGSLWTLGVVILVNLHLAMDTRRWTWITHVAIWGSIVATFICLIILDIIHGVGFLPHYWVIFHMLGMASYWLNILLIICLALLPRFFVNFVKDYFWPNDIQIAREEEILNDRNQRRLRPSKTQEVTLSEDP